jgi:N-acetyl-anhydromuramyl-L-alanine amidase AmpD
VTSDALLSDKWRKRARKLNPFYKERLGWNTPAGWPSDVGSDDFANRVAAMQKEHGGLTVDGILGPKTLSSMKGTSFVPAAGEYLIIAGKRVQVSFPVVTWEEPSGLSFYGKNGWSKRKDPTGKDVDLFVLHWDGCTSAHQCFHVLLERRLSVQLMLDGDGTVYQALDLAEARAWHGSEVNDRSIGIEIQNPVRLHRNQWQKPPRAVVKEAGVHGDLPYEHLDFYDIQKQRVGELAEVLCAHMGIPKQLPLDANGHVLQTLMPKGFKGVCGHYHVSKQKPDPGLTLWPGLKRAFETPPIPNV